MELINYVTAWENLSNAVNNAVNSVFNFFRILITLYPNKRVIHLALYHPKRRVRKKNFFRIWKWLFVGRRVSRNDT